MNLSHAYGPLSSPEDASKLLLHALDVGVRHFDTAAVYGTTAKEALIGEVLSAGREEYFLASKCGMTSDGGPRILDGRPETLRATLDAALRRLGTDHIDLYYLRRWDRRVPIEESVGALREQVTAGKIGTVGLSCPGFGSARRRRPGGGRGAGSSGNCGQVHPIQHRDDTNCGGPPGGVGGSPATTTTPSAPAAVGCGSRPRRR